MIASLVDQENSKPYTRLELSLSFVISQGKTEWSCWMECSALQFVGGGDDWGQFLNQCLKEKIHPKNHFCVVKFVWLNLPVDHCHFWLQHKSWLIGIFKKKTKNGFCCRALWTRWRGVCKTFHRNWKMPCLQEVTERVFQAPKKQMKKATGLTHPALQGMLLTRPSGLPSHELLMAKRLKVFR